MWDESKYVRYRFLNPGSGIDDGFGNITMQSRIAFDIAIQFLNNGEFY